MDKQVDKKCENCLHYEMCLERFRKLKKENHYIFIDENEYFAHADDCEFYITSAYVARKIFEELELEAPFFCENQVAYEHFNAVLSDLKKKHGSDSGIGGANDEQAD